MSFHSHSDQIVDIAEGVNSLLPPERKIEGVGENENVLQMLEKGGDLLGDTLETFNQRMTRISAANRLIGEVVQSRRRPLLGPSPG